MEQEERKIVTLRQEDFGAFWKYVSREDITDIDYNGGELWITNTDGERIIAERNLSADFLDQFCLRIADSVNGHFTPTDPILEAETDSLRISLIHEAVTTSGRSISIRHVSEQLRMADAIEAVQSGYGSERIISLLINCALAKMNICISGAMGIGKTECARFVSHYIPNEQRVITIEDSPEWHFKKINPGHDCVELKVSGQMTYSDLLKACLRQNATWIMLSEARSREVVDLIENLTSGAKCITTLHADDARKIPARMISMAGSKEDAERMEYNIYDCLDVGILIRRRNKRRYIDQICFFYRENGENKKELIVANGEIIKEFSEQIKRRFAREGIEDPFKCEKMKGEQEDIEKTREACAGESALPEL